MTTTSTAAPPAPARLRDGAKHYLLALGALLGIAFIVRLQALGAGSFWFDEVYSALLVTKGKSLSEVWAYVVKDDAHPPLYYTLMWAWAHVVGLGNVGAGVPAGAEWLLRLPGVILGTVNVALTAVLTQRLAGRRAAVLAAALVAFSGVMVAQDAQVRMLTLLTTFTLGSTLALDRMLTTPSRMAALTLGGLWLGMLYTQYLGGLILIAQLLWAAQRSTEARSAGRHWWLAAAPLALFLPWLPILLEQLRSGGAHPEFRLAFTFAAPRGLGMLLGGTWPAPAPFIFWPTGKVTPPLAFTVGMGGLALTLLGAGLRDTRVRAFALVPVGYAALWALISLWAVNIFDTRYLGTLYPLLAVVAAAGAVVLTRRLPQWGSALAVLPLLTAGALQVSAVQHTPLSRWADIRAIMQAQLHPGDVIAFSSGGAEFTSTYYLGDLPNTKRRVSLAELSRLVREGNRVWYIREYTQRGEVLNTAEDLKAAKAGIDWLETNATPTVVLDDLVAQVKVMRVQRK